VLGQLGDLGREVSDADPGDALEQRILDAKTKMKPIAVWRKK
jgi:hypothetical protein